MGKGEPRLIIGMPVRNGENFLGAALECLLAQSYTDFRIVLSDNSSSDRTRDIAEQYAARDERLQYVRQERDLGAAANFNFLVRTTESDLFKWAAHDDLCDPEYLRRTIELLDHNPEAVVAHSFTHVVNARDEIVGRYDDQQTLVNERPSRRLSASFHLRYPSPVWGVMRRAALERTKLIEGYLGSDWNFLGEMLLQGRLVLVPEYLFSVRMHDRGFSFGIQRESKQFRLAWFDPAARRPLLSAFQSAWRFVGAVLRHPLSPRERAACLGHIAIRFGRKLPAIRRAVKDPGPGRAVVMPAPPGAR